jgi:DNA-binding beta-propeller fold protein YncE
MTMSRHLVLRPFSVCVAVLLLGAALAAPLAASGHGGGRHRGKDTVWVTNRDQGTVMVFDAVTGDAIPDNATTPNPAFVGPGVHDIVVSSRMGKAFVSDDSSRVYVLSTSTRETIDVVEFEPLSRPHHLSLSHDGKTVYVGLFASNRIAAIDVGTLAVRVMPSSTQPGTTAHAPEPSPNDRFIFVPHEGQNLVSKVSARTGTVRAEVNPGPAANSSPSEVLPTRDGETLFVAMRTEGAIRTIDLDGFTVTADVVKVGVQPESLILTPGERTLIVSLRGTPARLAFLDTDPLALEHTLDIAGAGTFGDLAVPSPNGRFVYAVFDALAAGQGGVAKVDVHKRRVVDTFVYPGIGRPHGIAYVKARSRK